MDFIQFLSLYYHASATVIFLLSLYKLDFLHNEDYFLGF